MDKSINPSIVISAGKTKAELLTLFSSESEEISNLIRIRATLSFGNKTPITTKAEMLINKEIEKRINNLALNVIECLRVDDENAKK